MELVLAQANRHELWSHICKHKPLTYRAEFLYKSVHDKLSIDELFLCKKNVLACASEHEFMVS